VGVWSSLPSWGKVAAGFAGLAGGVALLAPARAGAAVGPAAPLPLAPASSRTSFPSATTDPHGHHTPPGREVAKVHTPVMTSRQFVAWVIPALERLGLTREQSILFAAHLARETATGTVVWDNNFPNIKALGPWQGDWYRLGPSGDAYEPFRAYATPDDGVRAALGLVSRGRRYARAWALLRAQDTSWYGALGAAGYYESDPAAAQAQYDTRFLPTVRRLAAGVPDVAPSGAIAAAPASARGASMLSLSRRGRR
jgi:hypothetical protein